MSDTTDRIRIYMQLEREYNDAMEVTRAASVKSTQANQKLLAYRNELANDIHGKTFIVDGYVVMGLKAKTPTCYAEIGVTVIDGVDVSKLT